MYKSIAINTRSAYWTSKENSDELIIDAGELATEITNQCNILEADGYKIISIIPLQSGNLNNSNGYIQTESVVVTAHKD